MKYDWNWSAYDGTSETEVDEDNLWVDEELLAPEAEPKNLCDVLPHHKDVLRPDW